MSCVRFRKARPPDFARPTGGGAAGATPAPSRNPLPCGPEAHLRIDSVAFVLSAGNAAECPAGQRVEIAVSGRSNVGKSSLLNSLFRRKDLVKVSNTPGKTQRLNYFLVNEQFHIVDLPGYGYAKAPEAMRDQWRAMMQQYLRTRRQLAAVIQHPFVLLVDP